MADKSIRSMARIKPQDRQTGVDTDTAVAVHVMGWFWQCNQWGKMAWFETDDTDPTPAFSEVGFYEWEMFRPSTNIAHAWRVLEHFTWPQFYTRLVRTSTGNWRCDIDLNGGDGPVRSAYAETAPLAICRAALSAVGL